MAINNPVISYENVAVLRNITGADVSFSNSGNYLEFITKVQDFSYSFNIENQNVTNIGSDIFSQKNHVQAPEVEISITKNEDFSNLFDMFKAPASPVIDKHPLNVDTNLYAIVGNEKGQNVTSQNLSGLSAISFGNCYLTNVTLNQSANGLLTTSYNFVASNVQAQKIENRTLYFNNFEDMSPQDFSAFNTNDIKQQGDDGTNLDVNELHDGRGLYLTVSGQVGFDDRLSNNSGFGGVVVTDQDLNRGLHQMPGHRSLVMYDGAIINGFHFKDASTMHADENIHQGATGGLLVGDSTYLVSGTYRSNVEQAFLDIKFLTGGSGSSLSHTTANFSEASTTTKTFHFTGDFGTSKTGIISVASRKTYGYGSMTGAVFTNTGYSNYKYMEVPQNITFEEAILHAAVTGRGRLAMPDTLEKWGHFTGAFGESPAQGWIGLTDSEIYGASESNSESTNELKRAKFKFLNGVDNPITDDLFWGTNEPNNVGGTEDFIQYGFGGNKRLNDLSPTSIRTGYYYEQVSTAVFVSDLTIKKLNEFEITTPSLNILSDNQVQNQTTYLSGLDNYYTAKTGDFYKGKNTIVSITKNPKRKLIFEDNFNSPTGKNLIEPKPESSGIAFRRTFQYPREDTTNDGYNYLFQTTTGIVTGEDRTDSFVIGGSRFNNNCLRIEMEPTGAASDRPLETYTSTVRYGGDNTGMFEKFGGLEEGKNYSIEFEMRAANRGNHENGIARVDVADYQAGVVTNSIDFKKYEIKITGHQSDQRVLETYNFIDFSAYSDGRPFNLSSQMKFLPWTTGRDAVLGNFTGYGATNVDSKGKNITSITGISTTYINAEAPNPLKQQFGNTDQDAANARAILRLPTVINSKYLKQTTVNLKGKITKLNQNSLGVIELAPTQGAWGLGLWSVEQHTKNGVTAAGNLSFNEADVGNNFTASFSLDDGNSTQQYYLNSLVLILEKGQSITIEDLDISIDFGLYSTFNNQNQGKVAAEFKNIRVYEVEDFDTSTFMFPAETIQSFNVNNPITRKTIYEIGKEHPIDRKTLFPMPASFDISSLVSDINSGNNRTAVSNLKALLDQESEYTVNISGNGFSNEKEYQFQINNCKMSSFRSSNTIGGFSSVDLSFDFSQNDFFRNDNLNNANFAPLFIDRANKNCVTPDVEVGQSYTIFDNPKDIYPQSTTHNTGNLKFFKELNSGIQTGLVSLTDLGFYFEGFQDFDQNYQAQEIRYKSFSGDLDGDATSKNQGEQVYTLQSDGRWVGSTGGGESFFQIIPDQFKRWQFVSGDGGPAGAGSIDADTVTQFPWQSNYGAHWVSSDFSNFTSGKAFFNQNRSIIHVASDGDRNHIDQDELRFNLTYLAWIKPEAQNLTTGKYINYPIMRARRGNEGNHILMLKQHENGKLYPRFETWSPQYQIFTGSLGHSETDPLHIDNIARPLPSGTNFSGMRGSSHRFEHWAITPDSDTSSFNLNEWAQVAFTVETSTGSAGIDHSNFGNIISFYKNDKLIEKYSDGVGQITSNLQLGSSITGNIDFLTSGDNFPRPILLDTQSTADFYIGGDFSTSGNLQGVFKGEMAAAAVYAKTLSHEEIADNFRRLKGRFKS